MGKVGRSAANGSVKPNINARVINKSGHNTHIFRENINPKRSRFCKPSPKNRAKPTFLPTFKIKPDKKKRLCFKPLLLNVHYFSAFGSRFIRLSKARTCLFDKYPS